jgi:calreticulin
MNKVIIAFALLVAVVSAEVYFLDKFTDSSKWVNSKSKEAEGSQGVFDISHGKYFGDAEEDKGLRTSQDAKFYQISAKFPEFSNKGKDLILQYSVKHEQKIDWRRLHQDFAKGTRPIQVQW